MSPRVFTKVVEAALVPLREAGIRVLNYLDDWLILAQSRALLCEHRDTVLSHLSWLGLQVNWEKSKLSPMQRISFLGMELDSVNLTARLSIERAQSMLSYLQCKRAAPLKHFQRLLGHMASAATVTPLRLLHMRPLQRWLHDRVPRWAWCHGTYQVSVTPSCRHTFSPWSDLAFLRAGVPLAQVSSMLLYRQMPLPRAGGPCATGMQLWGSGQGPSCSGISIASSYWQFGLLCAASKRCYTRSMYWSVRTTLRPLCTSTTKVVYAPVACRNSPAISSFGVRSI